MGFGTIVNGTGSLASLSAASLFVGNQLWSLRTESCSPEHPGDMGGPELPH